MGSPPTINQLVTHPAYEWYTTPPTSTDFWNPVCLEQVSTHIQVLGGPGNSNVTWQRTYAAPTNAYWNQAGNDVSFYFWAIGQKAIFKVTATNGCGNTIKYFPFISVSCGGGGGDPCEQFMLFPNPANEQIIIENPNLIPPPCDDPPIEEAKGRYYTKNLRIAQEINIYDGQYNLVMRQQLKAPARKFVLNTASLKSGFYIVEIKDGAYREVKRLIIRH